MTRLSYLAHDPLAPVLAVITHHVEEVPPSFTHGLVLQSGRMIAAGPLDHVVTSDVMSQAFSLPLIVERVDGRYWARRRTAG